MHDCNRDQLEPIHLHRAVQRGHIPSPRSHENHTRAHTRVHLFGREGLNFHVVLGMIIAILGMVWYGNASSKPGGKERRSYSLPKTSQPKKDSLLEASSIDAKVVS
ncbi:hypothetical protein HanLR1_Chr00c1813g0821531 [Helianthus annuus]|nr:hypothetical protein HanLR1_Chr00c1813g0821531 [Helianthus annuus]